MDKQGLVGKALADSIFILPAAVPYLARLSRSARCFATSQIQTSPGQPISPAAAARVLPSGLKVTAQTLPG